MSVMTDTIVPGRTQSSRPPLLSKTSLVSFARRQRSATVTHPSPQPDALDMSVKRRSLLLPNNHDFASCSASTSLLAAKERQDKRNRRQSLVQPTVASRAKMAAASKSTNPIDPVLPERSLSTRKRNSFVPDASNSTPRLPSVSASQDKPETKSKHTNRTSWSPAAKRLSQTAKQDVAQSKNGPSAARKTIPKSPSKSSSKTLSKVTDKEVLKGAIKVISNEVSKGVSKGSSTEPFKTTPNNTNTTSSKSVTKAPSKESLRVSTVLGQSPTPLAVARPRPQPLVTKNTAHEKALDESRGRTGQGDTTHKEHNSMKDTPAARIIPDDMPAPTRRRSSCITLNSQYHARTQSHVSRPTSPAEPGYMRRPMCEACNRHAKPTNELWTPRSMSPLDDGSHHSTRSTISPTTPISLISFSPPRRLKRQSCPSLAKRTANHPPSPTSSIVHTDSLKPNQMVRSLAASRVMPTETITPEMDVDDVWAQYLEKCIRTTANVESLMRERVGSENKLKLLLAEHQAINNKGEELERRLMFHEQRMTLLQRVEMNGPQTAYIDDMINLTSSAKEEESLSCTIPPLRVNIQPPTPLETTPTGVESRIPTTDSILQLRWHVSKLFGGAVATGMTLRRYQQSANHGILLIVSGTSVTTEPGLIPAHLQLVATETTIQQPSIVCHHYIARVTRHDARRRLQMLTYEHWVPDKDAQHCQFEHGGRPCPTAFGWVDRRHHCRKCGHVVCQTHSANQLPLFQADGDQEEWTRVCDTCFYSVMGLHLR